MIVRGESLDTRLIHLYMYMGIQTCTLANMTSLDRPKPWGMDGIEAGEERGEKYDHTCAHTCTPNISRKIGDFSSAVFLTLPPNINMGLSPCIHKNSWSNKNYMSDDNSNSGKTKHMYMYMPDDSVMYVYAHFQSPQHSWWDLALVETGPAHWVTSFITSRPVCVYSCSQLRKLWFNSLVPRLSSACMQYCVLTFEPHVKIIWLFLRGVQRSTRNIACAEESLGTRLVVQWFTHVHVIVLWCSAMHMTFHDIVLYTNGQISIAH